MIELRTLGALELRGTDGREFRPILQQPKRLALLAYLAVATPRRFHRRDSLLARFWPDLDTDHARGALRRSLHFLRRTLGDNVILGRGDEEIGLSPDSIWCDTTAFDASLQAGDLTAAIELYRGELLQGFYIAGAPEFERWLDTERARLLLCAVSAGWTVAESLTTSNPSEATRRARLTAALTPYDDAAHRRLIAMLAQAGDRAGALRAHDEFARRLRADYEMEPSAEMLQLGASVRADDAHAQPDAGAQREASAPGSANAPTAATARRPVASPNVVAVFPFTVRGSRDLAYLGEGMVDLLSTTLDGAGDLRAVDPRALLAHLAHEDGRPIDPQRGRTVARSLGAGRFLLGSIVLAGGRIRISATLYDGSTNPAGTAEVTGNSEAGLFDMIDDLTRELLGGNDTGPARRLAKLAARTTESLPALKAYLRGECEFRAGRYFQALESFQNAAAEDTCFALAYYRLAAAAAATADLDLARESSEQASRNRDRLGQHDRLLLDAQRAWLRGAADEAERLYTAALSTHVDDVEAWFALGDVLFHHNPQRGRPMAESREAFERALSFDADHLASLVHLARLAAFEGRRTELDTLVDQVLRLSPAGDRALSMRALRAFALRNEIEKARTVTALGRARALAVGIAFTDILLYAHDLVGSHRLARVVTRLTRGREAKALGHVTLALLNVTRGRFEKATVELDRADALGTPWALELRALFALHPYSNASNEERRVIRDALTAWNADGASATRNQVFAMHNGVHPVLRHYLIGSMHASLGAADEAIACAERLESEHAATQAGNLAGFLSRSVRAQVARRAGDPAAALQLLGAAPLEVWYQLTITSPFFSAAHERFLRAELLSELGRSQEAIGWYASLGESSPFELVYLAPARLRLSEIHARQGRHQRAAEDAEQVMILWEGGDAHVRMLHDATANR